MYSIIEIARSAGYHTYWLSNQTEHGMWGELIAALGKSADTFNFISGRGQIDNLSNPPDGDLLSPLQKTLDESRGPTLIFLHIMGSHFTYDARYPADFARFDQDTAFSANPDVNTYDNTILYTDHILQQIVGMLRQRPEPVGMVYFSDHGESPFFHIGHDPANFDNGLVEVPMAMWVSAAYDKLYPSILQTAHQNRGQPFMLDRLTPTLMTFAHIAAPFYQPADSLLSAAYKPQPRLTMEGAIDYDKLQLPYCLEVKLFAGKNIAAHCVPKPQTAPEKPN